MFDTPFAYNPNEPNWVNLMVAYNLTGDIDPTYFALHKLAQTEPQLTKRLLVVYSLFYHMGFACRAAESPNTFQFVVENYATAPRGKSRRHFRGNAGQATLKYLSSKPLEQWFDEWYDPEYHNLVTKFKPVPAFGDYFIWKYADFYDRVFNMPVPLNDSHLVHLPKEPIKGAKLIAELEGINYNLKHVFGMIQTAANRNLLNAVPDYQRRFGIAEIETFLCGVRHSYTGTDYVGKDIDTARNALDGQGDLAQQLQSYLPPAVPKGWYREEWMVRKQPQASGLDIFFGE